MLLAAPRSPGTPSGTGASPSCCAFGLLATRFASFFGAALPLAFALATVGFRAAAFGAALPRFERAGIGIRSQFNGLHRRFLLVYDVVAAPRGNCVRSMVKPSSPGL